MATDHRRVEAELVQEVLLDDPGFLREVVERAVQQILEAEMTEHLGAAPYERVEGRTGQRNGYKPRALRTRVGRRRPRSPGPGTSALLTTEAGRPIR